jgi:hypothetical protein
VWSPNNRTERNIEVVNSNTDSSGADIFSYYFQSLLADLRIYGVSRDYFKKIKVTDSLTGLATGSISYRTAITFKFQTAESGGSAVPILGFKAYRSSDGGTNWSLIGVENYGGLTTGSNGTHTYYDADSQLEEGVEYEYKIVAFTDDTHTKESAVMGPVTFLPAFTASLVGPANKTNAVDANALPDFTVQRSNPDLYDVSAADGVYFSPVIRTADGTHVYYGYFYYATSSGKLYYWTGSSWAYYTAVNAPNYITLDAVTCIVSLKPAIFNAATNRATGAALQLESGTTYYWDIFGDYEGNASVNVSAYFVKSGTNCISRSYADVYQNGQQTLNGWFSFTVE